MAECRPAWSWSLSALTGGLSAVMTRTRPMVSVRTNGADMDILMGCRHPHERGARNAAEKRAVGQGTLEVVPGDQGVLTRERFGPCALTPLDRIDDGLVLRLREIGGAPRLGNLGLAKDEGTRRSERQAHDLLDVGHEHPVPRHRPDLAVEAVVD